MLIDQTGYFDTPILRQLIRSGKAGELIALGVPGGFVLVMKEGVETQTLAAQRGHHRRFKRIDSVASYLAGLGATKFCVDLGQWTPEALL